VRQTSAIKPSIAFVGAGALAAGLGQTLHQHGYSIDEIVVRSANSNAKRLAAKLGARLVSLESAALLSKIVWLAVPDDAIATCSEALATRRDWNGRVVLHSSGALSSAVLGSLKTRGAAVASLHPMMTFVSSTKGPSRDSLRGVSFAVEGDPAAAKVATAIARELGGEVLKLSPKRKAAYHAFGSFLSPLIVAELTAAEEVAKLAGISKAQAQRIMRPIVQRTVANYLDNGGQKAFSGPLVRGDVETVRRHVEALNGQTLDAYRALAQLAVRNLKVKNRKQLLEVLAK
jgi:predicted short-subunit dehydrogenase-like oxidoreductase (DUF2520 family)